MAKRAVFAPPRLLALGLGWLAFLPFESNRAVATPSPIADPPNALSIPYQKYQLKNGLEVILHRDNSLPLVAVNIWYHVGPANEPRGRSGFAHLFEHLMFEGSRYVGRRFDSLLESAGATDVNGTTSWDRTNYFETVPREHLQLVLWIESDRMGFMLDVLNQKRLDVQRGVVKNERRQSYENAPYGPSALELYDAMFPPGHPYHGAVIGSMQDLNAAKLSDVKEFFKQFYTPGNATLAIAGDFEEAKLRQLVDKYFAGLPGRPLAKTPRRTTPALSTETRLTVREPVTLAKVSAGYITPPAYSADDIALDVAMAILGGGKATRLYRTLVVDKKLASEVSAELDSNELCSMVELTALAASKAKPQELLAALDVVIAELAAKGPSAAELARAKRGILLSLVDNLQLLNGGGGEAGRAGLLQRFNHYLGKPDYLGEYLKRIESVQIDDVKRVVQQHLPPSKRVVVTTLPVKEHEQ